MVSDRRLLIRTPLINVITRSIYNAVRHIARDFNEVDLLLNTTNGPGEFASRCYDRVQDLLVTELQSSRPRFGLKIINEADTIGTDDEQFWVIAPISGMKNFMNAHPHFALSVAVELKGQILASAVYDPINDEMFYAERRQGVYVNERRIQPRRNVTTAETLALFAGNPQHAHSVFGKLSETSDLRVSGAPALDLCYAAAGRAGVVWVENEHPYETAAGHFILQEAAAHFQGCDSEESYLSTHYLAGDPTHVAKVWKKLS
ncbi:MAG: hypothetical protein H6849_01150 [Alphaproteobacteria bacterium]|nr:MAG: hypothetical protein H6849_01150 [Alphaproteobacteria bacterium]